MPTPRLIQVGVLEDQRWRSHPGSSGTCWHHVRSRNKGDLFTEERCVRVERYGTIRSGDGLEHLPLASKASLGFDFHLPSKRPHQRVPR
ncbi:hypothetical protein ZHAS_00004967 [Anopheles sinensis]|uniref:Uncharacterized protein n=1 Tax=Anopheles sinensis TaxID=74873 RepID=A0A084VIK7_ANOSI|nr:hypothetical protein ZHAS_00004967 [Anopheles sinensis]